MYGLVRFNTYHSIWYNKIAFFSGLFLHTGDSDNMTKDNFYVQITRKTLSMVYEVHFNLIFIVFSLLTFLSHIIPLYFKYLFFVSSSKIMF